MVLSGFFATEGLFYILFTFKSRFGRGPKEIKTHKNTATPSRHFNFYSPTGKQAKIVSILVNNRYWHREKYV